MKKVFGLTVALSVALALVCSAFALNPQPEPPKPVFDASAVNAAILAGINPQPEPPGIVHVIR